MSHEMHIHGHKVIGEDDYAKHGMEYLSSSLSGEEAESLFSAAKEQGEVEFQDSHKRDFTLVEGANMSFTVVSRKPEKRGWF